MLRSRSTGNHTQSIFGYKLCSVYVVIIEHLNLYSVGIATGCGLGGPEIESCRSQWPIGLRRVSAAPRLLGLGFRIPARGWKFGLCVVSKDKWQNAGQSRHRSKYGWSTEHKIQNTEYKKNLVGRNSPHPSTQSLGPNQSHINGYRVIPRVKEVWTWR